MRLIDADELKEHKFLTPDAEEAKKWLPAETQGYQLGWNDCIYAIVENAPPIETTIENLISTLSVEELKATTRFKVDIPSGEAISFRREETGRWIDHSEDEGYLECPICGCLTNCNGNKEELHYCWNCGAAMRKEAEE